MRLFLPILLTLLVLSGCGYTVGYVLPDGVYRLAVPVFENKTFPIRREVEFDLTRAVKQELELRTDVALVSQSSADAVLEGAVVSFREAPLTEGPLDEEQESTIDVVVEIRLLRTRDGSVIVERTIQDQEDFSVLRGQTLADARASAIQEIAERIVLELEAW